MDTLASELRDMVPTWAVSTLLPLPIINFWQQGPGNDFAYAYLFLGCALLAAERFSPNGNANRPNGGTLRQWRAKVSALLLAMTGAAAVFTAFVWAVTGRADALVPLFALLAFIPAIGCVPFVAVITGRPYLAVLTVVVLLAAVKMVGCIVVVLVYGWNAQAEGYTTLPWESPNLLVWLCLAGAMTSSAALFALGRRAFLQLASLRAI